MAVTIIILFFVAVALFSINNYDLTTVRVPYYKAPFFNVYEMPKIGLMLMSMVSGAIFLLILVALRDTRRFIEGYQTQKRQKKEERIESLYSRSLYAMMGNDMGKARELLEGILKEEPEHKDALMRMGDVSASTGSRDKAAEYYRRALASSPGDLEALFALEKEMQEAGRLEEAMAYVDEILDARPDNLVALDMKRAVLEKKERWSDLIEVQKSILKHINHAGQEAEEARLHGYKYEHARQSLEAGEFDRAGKLFRSILRYDKDFIPAYLGAAEVLLREDDAEGAVEFLERGYQQTGSAVILARLEDLLISLGEPERVLRIYREAVSRRPNDIRIKFLLGKLYYRLEMIDDAFEALRAIEAAESYPALYSLLGELYIRREQYEKAALSFRKAMDTKIPKLQYCCENCGTPAPEWAGRCPNCGSWSTYNFDIYGRCRF